jgi:hypothetical protein
MELPRFSKSIRKVVQLQKNSSGELTPVVIYEKRSKTKKVSPVFRPLERMVRDMARAQAAFAGTYLEHHDRSNEKASDGFVRDFASNTAKAAENAAKKLGLAPMFRSSDADKEEWEADNGSESDEDEESDEDSEDDED